MHLNRRPYRTVCTARDLPEIHFSVHVIQLNHNKSNVNWHSLNFWMSMPSRENCFWMTHPVSTFWYIGWVQTLYCLQTQEINSHFIGISNTASRWPTLLLPFWFIGWTLASFLQCNLVMLKIISKQREACHCIRKLLIAENQLKLQIP